MGRSPRLSLAIILKVSRLPSYGDTVAACALVVGEVNLATARAAVSFRGSDTCEVDDEALSVNDRPSRAHGFLSRLQKMLKF